MNYLVQGHRAYAYTGGKPFDPALPCVVFVHGALNDHSVWTLLARWFAHHGHAVLAVDLPGHGRSGGPPAASVEAAATWLLALLQAAGVERAAFVGHSMGSLVALEAAALAGDRASALAMIGTAAPMKVSDALLTLAREKPLAAIDLVVSLSLSSLAIKPSVPGPGAWLHGSQRALMRRLQAQAARELQTNLFAHDFATCDAYGGAMRAASGVRCRSSLVLGRRDQMTPPGAARELTAALKATVTTLPAGHSLMSEAPDAVLAAVRAAVASMPPS